MTLAVIGSGFGRTGTTSLKNAIELLGLGPCHHMEEVIGNPSQLPYWEEVAAGGTPDWAAVFQAYGSVVDWPSAHVWRELSAAFPSAKVVHTVRPEEEWWTSFSNTIGTLIAGRHRIPVPHIRAVMEMGNTIVEQTFGAPASDKGAAIAAYRRRTEEVKAALPPERLLVFNVAEGWAPLCSFLGKPVPDKPFPRANDTEAFRRLISGMAGDLKASEAPP